MPNRGTSDRFDVAAGLAHLRSLTDPKKHVAYLDSIGLDNHADLYSQI